MQLYASTLRESYSWLPETETISIDDADLSDSSSESEIVRRPPRRLPNRRDLEFAAAEFSAARTDSVSSLGAPSTVPSIQSALSASDPTTPDHTGGPIQAWQIDFLGEESDDEAGPGDAEAALQRLEGQIDAEAQRLRDSKVDKWLKRVQELSLKRAAGGAPFGGGGVLDLVAGINFEDEDEVVDPEGATDPVVPDDSAYLSSCLLLQNFNSIPRRGTRVRVDAAFTRNSIQRDPWIGSQSVDRFPCWWFFPTWTRRFFFPTRQ
jgi:hypothetical protein